MKKILPVLFLILSAHFCLSQRAMVLSDRGNKDTWIMNYGDRIKYELGSNPNGMYTGIIEDIKDSSFIVSGQEIRFLEIRMIKVSRKHGRTSLILGMFLAGIGLASNSANDMVGGVVPANVITVTQIVFIGSGTYFFIKGIAELCSTHRCYFDRGWKLRSVLSSTLKD